MTPRFNDAATGAPIMATSTGPPQDALLDRYGVVRERSRDLCASLETEDFVVQSMPDVSPTKWHLAHTSWFFETFLLREHLPGYEPYHPSFAYLFNSYYNTMGEQHARPERGLLTRPTVGEVFDYRRHVDAGMARLLGETGERGYEQLRPLVEIGLHHEEQHQELMLTDIKHVFATNPLRPAFRDIAPPKARGVPDATWHEHPEGIRELGWDGEGFAFDNERPRHRNLVPAFAMASRLVTNGEFLEFVSDRGYERPDLWLSDGWRTVQENGWECPLYWRRQDGEWLHMTLGGERPVVPEEPVCHVSFYEADAYARWAGARLPEEAEWETVAERASIRGNFLESEHFHPVPLGSGAPVERASAGSTNDDDGPAQLFGDVWEWTRTPYRSYPGYRPPAGALGEYNAKFMCNQMVLRGGSCATPVAHVRPTYRNFFPPDARWQFMGFRLAKDLAA